MSDTNKKVQVFKRINKLKLKAGIPLDSDEIGHIDPAAVKRAQALIDTEEENYAEEIEKVLVQLDSVWKDLKTADKKQFKKIVNQMYNYANNIMDLANTYNYRLMAYFGHSLRDFCEKIDVENEAHHIIVQAHIDVMWVAFENNIHDEGGKAAQELKAMVAKAIEKHS